MLNQFKKSLIPFVMAGYPSFEESLRYSIVLIEEGATALEVGVPYSDPLADGPVIQHAAHVALSNGTNLNTVFLLVREIKKLHPNFPIILFTYLNPILRYGLKNYVRSAVQAGADATLCVDLPPEEADAYVQFHREVNLNTVFLASPTTSPKRLKQIALFSTSFLYYVSRPGVTGEAAQVSSTLAHELNAIRAEVSLPVAVGFGISTPEQAGTVSKYADAVVIGSRFLSLMALGHEAEPQIRALARNSILAMNRGDQK